VGVRQRTPSRSERRLAARLARGDNRALAEIQDQYGGVLRGYLQQTLSDRSAAEDVLQQVMLEVWQRGGSFDAKRGSMLSWLMAITRSRAIDHVRRRVPEPHDPETTTRLLDSRETELAASEQLADEWQMAHLLTLIPRQEARILWLRFHRDLSQSEIAAETGIALGTVKMRMVSGLGRLRKLMEQQG
jgi:RNA polymerase sigma-70 factor (ECF subfamily)